MAQNQPTQPDLSKLTREDVELAKAAFKAFSQALERQSLYAQGIKIRQCNQFLREKNQAAYEALDAEISREMQERQNLDEHIFRLIYKVEHIFVAQNPGQNLF